MVQNPLVEYQFKVEDIFEDLQDGVRLCRAVQLLQHDPSILMVSLIVYILFPLFSFLLLNFQFCCH